MEKKRNNGVLEMLKIKKGAVGKKTTGIRKPKYLDHINRTQ